MTDSSASSKPVSPVSDTAGERFDPLNYMIRDLEYGLRFSIENQGRDPADDSTIYEAPVNWTHGKIRAWIKALKEARGKAMGDAAGEWWPRRGEAFGNAWYCNAPDFVRLLATQNMMWHQDHGLKYLNVRIDTRSGHFVLSIDGSTEGRPERIEIERALNALRLATESFGMQQWKRTPAVAPAEEGSPVGRG